MHETTSRAGEPIPLTPEAVLEFFDQQLLAGVDVTCLVARAAHFAHARVGFVSDDGTSAAADRWGEAIDPEPTTDDSTALTADGSRVWVGGLDPASASLVLDRLAVAAVLAARLRHERREDRDPLEILIDRSASAQSRKLALTRLKLQPDHPVRVVMCSGPESGIAQLLQDITRIEPLIARMDRDGRTVLLIDAARSRGDALRRESPRTDSLDLPGIPSAVRASYGVVSDAGQAWIAHRNARDAYRFALPSSQATGPYPTIMATWVNGARLSALGALCRLSREEIEAVPEVHILEAIAEKHGEFVLNVLEAYAATESMRRGAAQIHMHYNSIRYWIEKAEAQFGYSLIEPYRRATLFVSLCLVRLRRDGDFD